MKRICLNDIESQHKILSYKELYDKVLSLIQCEELKPVKASGKNGKVFPLYVHNKQVALLFHTNSILLKKFHTFLVFSFPVLLLKIFFQCEELKPVKASGKNGKKPALYNEYWIIEEPEDNSIHL